MNRHCVKYCPCVQIELHEYYKSLLLLKTDQMSTVLGQPNIIFFLADDMGWR